MKLIEVINDTNNFSNYTNDVYEIPVDEIIRPICFLCRIEEPKVISFIRT